MFSRHDGLDGLPRSSPLCATGATSCRMRWRAHGSGQPVASLVAGAGAGPEVRSGAVRANERDDQSGARRPRPPCTHRKTPHRPCALSYHFPFTSRFRHCDGLGLAHLGGSELGEDASVFMFMFTKHQNSPDSLSLHRLLGQECGGRRKKQSRRTFCARRSDAVHALAADCNLLPSNSLVLDAVSRLARYSSPFVPFFRWPVEGCALDRPSRCSLHALASSGEGRAMTGGQQQRYIPVA